MTKGTKTALIIIGVIVGCVVVLAILAALAFNLIWKGVESGIENLQAMNDFAVDHVELLQKGDVEGAYETTSDLFKQETTLEEYRTMVEGSVLSDIDGYSFNSFSLDNNVLTLTGTITSDDTKVPVQVVATKQNDVWTLTSIELNPAGFDTESDSLFDDDY